MIIPVFSSGHFSVKTGIRRDINFTPQDRINSLTFRLSVKINHSVHYSVIGDRRTVHPKLFHSCNIFFYLVRTIQKTVFCMDMQMCKTHLSPRKPTHKRSICSCLPQKSFPPRCRSVSFLVSEVFRPHV